MIVRGRKRRGEEEDDWKREKMNKSCNEECKKTNKRGEEKEED